MLPRQQQRLFIGLIVITIVIILVVICTRSSFGSTYNGLCDSKGKNCNTDAIFNGLIPNDYAEANPGKLYVYPGYFEDQLGPDWCNNEELHDKPCKTLPVKGKYHCIQASQDAWAMTKNPPFPLGKPPGCVTSNHFSCAADNLFDDKPVTPFGSGRFNASGPTWAVGNRSDCLPFLCNAHHGTNWADEQPKDWYWRCIQNSVPWGGPDNPNVGNCQGLKCGGCTSECSSKNSETKAAKCRCCGVGGWPGYKDPVKQTC